MEKNNSDIFIISGEKSGDIHGSYIIENLLKSNSSLKIDCWGGPQMENAGGNILEANTDKELAYNKRELLNPEFLVNYK